MEIKKNSNKISKRYFENLIEDYQNQLEEKKIEEATEIF